MRKNYLFSFLCIATLFLVSITFSSCSKDHDDEENNGGNNGGTEEVDDSVNVLDKIKDPVFKEFIKTCMRINAIKTAKPDFLTPTEAAVVDNISLTSAENKKEIESIEGIQYFTGIEKLAINYTSVTYADLSKNTKLKELNALECTGNTLSIISPSVERLDISYVKSETITLDAPKLNYINCQDARVTELNTSKCPGLKTLRCGGSKIKALDLSQNPELEELSCGGSGNISSRSLDISKNKKLHSLWAGMGNAPLLRLYVWWEGGRDNVPSSFKTFFIEEKTDVLKKED